jgi:hypothetical protein
VTVDRPVASEPPDDRPGWRLKLAVLAVLTLVSFGAIIALALAEQGDAATAITGTWVATCTVLAILWRG